MFIKPSFSSNDANEFEKVDIKTYLGVLISKDSIRH